MGLLPQSGLLLVAVVLLSAEKVVECSGGRAVQLLPHHLYLQRRLRAQIILQVPATTALECNTDICVKSCENCDEGTQVPDPENCRGFYICGANGTLVNSSLNCMPGEVFNATEHKCVEGENCVSCPSPPTSTCVYECAGLQGTAGNIAILTDCQHYYKCDAAGAMTPMICPADTPFFGGELCEADETNCCNCHPFCYTDAAVYSLAADPLNCRNYYLCTEPGKVPTLPGSCPDGQNFDSFTKQCSDLVSCVTQCTNMIGTNGCIDPFTCLETGFFAKCPSRCTPDYYHCTEATGEYQDVESCSTGTFYNPDTHQCVTAANCPYPL